MLGKYDFLEKVHATIQERVIKKDRNQQKPVRQHFVPESYQKRFRGPENTLWAYLFDQKPIRQNAQPRIIGSVPNLYTLFNRDGTSDYYVEYFFGVLEDESAPVIKKLIHKEEITEEERFWLCYFWGAQFCRSLDMISSYQSLFGEFQIQSLRRKYSSLEETKRMLQMEPCSDPTFTAEELFEHVHSDEYDVVYETSSILPVLLRLIPRIVEILWQSRITVLTAPENKSFVTGDCSVVLRPLDKPTKSIGFDVPGIARVMPISWDTCLISDSIGSGIRRKAADRDLVRSINLAIASEAHKFIIGRNAELIASLIKATGANSRVWSSSLRVSTAQR